VSPARRLTPVLLLVGYAVAFAAAAFGGGLPAFDDHPGQFFRLWHFLERSLPAGAWTADWSPDWWGGYPELQFYPPGFAIVGALIRLVGLWQLSVPRVYQILCVVILLLPAATTYLLVARTVEDGWLALPPAFLALTLSGELRGGVEEGLRWGILTSRLALGLLPLLVLSLRPWLDDGRRPVWTPIVAAAVILAHPAAAPAVATILGAAGLLVGLLRPGRPTLRRLAALSLLAVGLTVFWTGPLLVRRAWVVPLAWGEATLAGLAADVAVRPLLLVLILAALLAWGTVIARRRPFDAVLAVLPLAMVSTLAADVWLFARGWSAVEPARLFDAVIFTALWAAALGLGHLGTRLLPPVARGPARPAAALLTVAVLAFLPDRAPGPATLTLWPRAEAWPRLETISETRELPRLWAALRGTDRVLFLTSSLRLDRNPAWYAPHTHVTALAPLLAGREIVNGTFTHPSPIAARFYTGSLAPPARLTTLVEKLDGQRLLGAPWERVSADAFDDFARRLRIAAVVVPTAEARRAHFLDFAYTPGRQAAGFTIYERRDRPWPRVERITHRRYRVLATATGGLWIPTGIAAYPLWRVKSARGALETRVDAWGCLELHLPLDVFEAELVYSEGPLEWASLVVSALALAFWVAWARRSPPEGGAARSAARAGPRRAASPRAALPWKRAR
jgi:hypothetical protein